MSPRISAMLRTLLISEVGQANYSVLTALGASCEWGGGISCLVCFTSARGPDLPHLWLGTPLIIALIEAGGSLIC